MQQNWIGAAGEAENPALTPKLVLIDKMRNGDYSDVVIPFA
jgi:hypothetical protein